MTAPATGAPTAPPDPTAARTATPGTSTAIEVTDLRVRFRRCRTDALAGVNLTVRQDETVALIGTNGAGKSTLLRSLVRLVEPVGGRITLGDTDVTAASRRELRTLRRDVGFVFQRFHLVPRLTAFHNVVHGAMGRRGTRCASPLTAPGEVRREAMRALERVGLADHADRRVDTLSGGQQQRVAVARMLMQRPRIVLADEPVASLDPSSANTVLELLTSVATEGVGQPHHPGSGLGIDLRDRGRARTGGGGAGHRGGRDGLLRPVLRRTDRGSRARPAGGAARAGGRPVLPSATVSRDAAGRVTAIDPDPGAPPYDPASDDMPTGSLLLVPAAVDLHLDNLVQRRRPRAGVTLEHAAVITALDAECTASGITTVCVAARCEHSPRKGIDIADALPPRRGRRGPGPVAELRLAHPRRTERLPRAVHLAGQRAGGRGGVGRRLRHPVLR
jgi:phosphonate transport system ATP-binding protein